MWTYNGRVIKENRAWTDDNGVQHPANWHIWSADEKISKGLVWVDRQTPPDSRFYWWSQNPDGTYTTTPKALEDIPTVDDAGIPVIDPITLKQLSTPGLKSQAVAQTKQTQGYLLSATDWAYIRKTDTGIDVPADIQQYRNEVRLAAGMIEDRISQCTTLEQFMALYETPVDADGTPTGNAPINDWPEIV